SPPRRAGPSRAPSRAPAPAARPKKPVRVECRTIRKHSEELEPADMSRRPSLPGPPAPRWYRALPWSAGSEWSAHAPCSASCTYIVVTGPAKTQVACPLTSLGLKSPAAVQVPWIEHLDSHPRIVELQTPSWHVGVRVDDDAGTARLPRLQTLGKNHAQLSIYRAEAESPKEHRIGNFKRRYGSTCGIAQHSAITPPIGLLDAFAGQIQ